MDFRWNEDISPMIMDLVVKELLIGVASSVRLSTEQAKSRGMKLATS